MTTPDQNYESLKAVYKVCIETRNFEINQLIQRNNFFMLFQGVLLAAALQNQGSKPAVELIICLTGIFVSIYQLQMASGAKYWQEWWESRLEEYEQKLGEHQDANDASFHDLFTASSDSILAKMKNAQNLTSVFIRIRLRYLKLPQNVRVGCVIVNAATFAFTFIYEVVSNYIAARNSA